MNKSELIEQIAKRSGLPLARSPLVLKNKKESVSKVWHTLFLSIIETLFHLNVLHNLCFLLGCCLRNHNGKDAVGNAC